MRKLIPTILAILISIASATAQEGITFEVAAPTVVETGVPFRIEFTISSLKAEFSPPDFGGFEVQAGPIASRGSNISITNGDVTRTEGTTWSYVISASSAGVHTISAAEATVGENKYSTKPLSIEVVARGSSASAAGSLQSGAEAGQGSAPEISDEDVFVVASANRTEVYKGEPVIVTFKLYRRINAGFDEFKLPAFNGFWYQDITPAEPALQRETYNNRVYEAGVLKEYLLYPQQSGTLTIEPLEATAHAAFQVRTSTPRDIFDEMMGFGQTPVEVQKKIASRPVRIDVREWPAGAPEHFDGAVGEFTLDVTPPPSAMNANTSGSYTLRLSGTGNFPLIRAPKLSLPQSFEQYNVTTSDNTRHTRAGTSGYREFSYPFIPRSDGLYTIPSFEFSYFDPRQKRYITLPSRDTSIEVAADSTAVTSPGGGMVSGVSREDLRVFGQDIRFIKRGGAGLRPKGRTFMFSPLYISLVGLLAAMFVAGFLLLPRYVRNMQSDRFVRGKRANKVALRRFRAAETSMKRDDRHGFYDEMLKALWGYMSDKFDIPMADLTKERIQEELFERSIPEAQSIEYVRIISECEEAQYSPVSSSRMGELYREGVALVSELESASRNAGGGGFRVAKTKRFIICLLTVLTSSVGLAMAQEPAATDTPGVSLPAQGNNTLWEEANAAYYEGDFASAAALYDSIEQSGMVSAKLYYNKASALFKMGKIGESILYYHKAQRLAPADVDIAHNLEIASSYTRNRIEPVPEFFLKQWMRKFSSMMSGNGWAWLSIVMFALVLAGALLYLLPIGRRARKAGFYGGLAALVLLIFAFSFARRDYRETENPTGGIVTNPSAAVKSSPDNSGTDLFLLYEGDEVRVLDRMNDWSEIVVANGNRGWIRSAAISMID